MKTYGMNNNKYFMCGQRIEMKAEEMKLKEDQLRIKYTVTNDVITGRLNYLENQLQHHKSYAARVFNDEDYEYIFEEKKPLVETTEDKE